MSNKSISNFCLFSLTLFKHFPLFYILAIFSYLICLIIALCPVTPVILQANFGKDYTPPHSQTNELTNWKTINSRQVNLNETEWTNPCFTFYLPWNTTAFKIILNNTNFTKTITKSALILKILRTFRIVVTSEFQKIKNISIHISDIRIWRFYEKAYKFLPKIPSNNCISLKRCHRHLQIFVAYFSYLNKAQLYLDAQRNLNLPGKVATYLQNLRNSAQSVLCNLEYVFNSIKLLRPKMKNFIYIPSHIMKHRLGIISKNARAWQKRSTHKPNGLTKGCGHKVTPLDLKLLKSKFLTYLRRLIKVLRVQSRNYYFAVKKKKHIDYIPIKTI